MKREFRILIVDDETIVCERLAASLGKLGFHVEAYSSSAEAIDRLSERRYDVLVTDLKMPGPSGMDVLNFVSKHRPTTKVIVITGFATKETATEVKRKGAVRFIPKPFKMNELRDLILEMVDEQDKGGSGEGRETVDTGS